ncbi:MAG: hypothetical protein ACLQLG_18595 [Thermoguttaceae bacterium]
MANATTIVTSLSDAKLYRGAPGSTGSASILCATVENVSLKLTFTEAPANNRNSGIEQSVLTLAKVEAEVNFWSDTADTHLLAFRQAMIGRQPIPININDGSAAGGLLFAGLMGVSAGDNDQQLPNVPGNKFTLKPWAVGAAGNQPQLGA